MKPLVPVELCDHPVGEQHYNGMQELADGDYAPLFTCLKCGTTLVRKDLYAYKHRGGMYAAVKHNG